MLCVAKGVPEAVPFGVSTALMFSAKVLAVSALQEYDAAFTSAKHRLDGDEIQMLQAFAVSAKAVWVLQAVRELKAANRGKVIRNPKNYLFGILGNWLTDGLPNDNKAAQQSLDDFYRQEGIT